LTSVPAATPPRPVAQDPPESWKHYALFEGIRNALYILPSNFTSELSITGVLATDLFTFNSSLGATIEAQVIEQLNALHTIWDLRGTYADYAFVRQAQRFPDVILCSVTPGATEPILMGIELKGWCILAKEGEPSFRYKVSPNVCAPPDLLVVYPWALANVTTGAPRLYAPYVVSARFAAEFKNWWWQHERAGRTSGNSDIHFAPATNFYPQKSDLISDDAQHDSGNNFGRYARTGVMDDYIAQRFAELLSGIPLRAWQRFLKIFSEGREGDAALRAAERLGHEFPQSLPELSDAQIRELQSRIGEIVSLLRES